MHRMSKIVKTYDYQDESGKLLFQVVRFEPKEFRQRRPDGKGGWVWNLEGVQRVPYRLPELITASMQDWIIIAEGEKDCDRLVELGFVATCCPMGAGKWRDEYNTYFETRLIAILGDNDKAGRDHVEQVARSLYGVAGEIRIFELPGLVEKADVSDWLDGDGDKAKLFELLEATEPYKPDTMNCDPLEADWEPPAPLGQFNLPTFPLEAFPLPLCALSEFCAAVAESFQVPVDLPAILVLSVAGAALAKRIEVHVRGDHIEPVNLFTVIALPPATRKSGVFRVVTEPLAYFERQEAERLAPLIEQSRNERNILEERLKHAQKQAAKAEKSEDQQHYEKQTRELVDELSKHEALKSPQYIGDDATPESVAALLNDNGGRFALMSPEGDVFDLMAGRYSSGVPNFGVYLKGHAGDDIRVNRASRDRSAQYVRNPALSIGIAVQPEVLRGLSLKKGFRGRGLLGRFLYALPQSLLGSRKINPGSVQPEIVRAYQQHILAACGLEPVLDANGRPFPHVVTVGEDALQHIDDFAVEIEKRLGPGGDFEAMGDWVGKLVGAVCRIAGIFHGLIHAESGNPGRAQIDAETMLGAITIGEYLIPHAAAAFFAMGSDPDIDLARRILAWVCANELTEFSRREAYNHLRGSIYRVNEIDDPLKLLESHGYIREVEICRRGPGRKPSPTYKVNPLWLAQNTQNEQNCLAEVNSAHFAQCAQGVAS